MISRGDRALARIRGAVRKGARAEGGGIASMFALSLVPLTLIAFGALEFARAQMTRGEIQNALDAAALAVARSGETDAVKIRSIGQAAFAANYPARAGAAPTATFNIEEGVVLASVSTQVRTVSMLPSQQVSVSSEVLRGGDKLEVVLVLDNTYSMVMNGTTVVTDPAATKLHQLKLAGNAFVTTLENAARGLEEGSVKIGMVPFSNTVNVGSQYSNVSWLNRTGNSSDIFSTTTANRMAIFASTGISWGGCIEGRKAPYDVQETAPLTGDTLFTPYFAPDEPDNWTGANDYLNDGTNTNADRLKNVSKYNTTTWKAGRTGTYKLYNNYPQYALDIGYKYGPNMGCQISPLVRLSEDYPALKTAISNLKPAGDTNIPLGLMWGWHLLSPNKPFEDGAAYELTTTKKIIVLMTDGENNILDPATGGGSNYSGISYLSNGRIGITSGDENQRQAALDAKLATLCSNIRNRGIRVYAVRVEVAQGTSTVLQNCATRPSMFYDVQSASSLQQVFSSIAGEIVNIRISK